MGIIKTRQSSHLGSMVDVKRVRRESLEAGNDLINKNPQYRKLFKLYRKKSGLSGPEAKIRVAQIAKSGSLDHVLGKLENEKPLRPVVKSSENFGENLRYRRIKRRK